MNTETTTAWVKRPRWKVSHLMLGGTVTTWAMGEQAVTACGKHIAYDEHLGPEPTGIDTIDRCKRCRSKAAEHGADDAT